MSVFFEMIVGIVSWELVIGVYGLVGRIEMFKVIKRVIKGGNLSV